MSVRGEIIIRVVRAISTDLERQIAESNAPDRYAEWIDLMGLARVVMELFDGSIADDTMRDYMTEAGWWG